MVPPASSCPSRWRIEPVYLKTFPQRHPRSMQHYPKIAVADGEDRANLFARHTIHFAHGKNGTDFFRQFEEAMTHDLPEFGTMHHLIRLGFHSCARDRGSRNRLTRTFPKTLPKEIPCR